MDHNCWSSINDEIMINYSECLGKGTFSDVFKGFWKSKGCLVAIKKIKQQYQEDHQMISQEINIMQQIKHPNVLNFLCLIKSQQKVFLIIEFCEGGSLKSQIQKQPIPQMNCYEYIKQIIFGMAAVSRMNHIHRDIKPQNILFTKYKTLRLCDFGLARRIIGKNPNQKRNYSFKGTPYYASPQILNQQKYSGLCDVWSVGLVLIQMLTQKCPTDNVDQVFNINSLKSYQKKITKKQGHIVLDGKYNEFFKQLVAKMTKYQQNERPSFQELEKYILQRDNNMIIELSCFGKVEETNSQNNDIETKTTYLHQSVKAINIYEPNSSINKLQEAQHNKYLTNILQSYIKFIYNRAKLFADMATKLYNSKDLTLHIGIKTLTLYLSIVFYVSAIEYLLTLIKNPKKTILPDGVIIQPHIFLSLDQTYTKALQKQKQKFLGTLQKLSSKFKNKCLAGFQQFAKNNRKIIELLDGFKQPSFNQNYLQYLCYYQVFILRQCFVNIDKASSSFVRIYYLMLSLTQLQQMLPIKEYSNIYMINSFIDQTNKRTGEELKVLITNLKSIIIEKNKRIKTQY